MEADADSTIDPARCATHFDQMIGARRVRDITRQEIVTFLRSMSDLPPKLVELLKDDEQATEALSVAVNQYHATE
jgi:hypothetical protein